MTNSIGQAFDQIGHILCVCPDPYCAEVFYLSESRPYLAGKQPHSVVDKLRTEEQGLDRLEEKLSEMESELRGAAAKAGQRTAKMLLKKIDPTFSGAGYDPQDVKVIFNPVSYVVFDGMARDKLKNIALLDRYPENAAIERIHKSISSAIKKGNCEFKTLRVNNEGVVITK